MTITTPRAVEAPPWDPGARPRTSAEWIARAEEVAAILRVGAVARGRSGSPFVDEVRLLQGAGLVTLLGPAAQGGAGQGWGTAWAVVRRVSEGDRSIGRLLGHHYLGSQLPALLGTAGQAEEIIRTATSERWFFGGPPGPGGTDLVAVDTGRDLVFSGTRPSPTGREVSDVTWLDAALVGHTERVVALAPSGHPGLAVPEGRGAPGPRRPASGGVAVRDVVLPWRSALGWVDKTFRSRPHAGLRAPTLGVVLANVHLGTAAGGLDAGPASPRARTGAWTHRGGVPGRAPDDPDVLEADGGLRPELRPELRSELRSELRAAQALADRAGDAVELLHIDPGSLRPRALEEAAVLVAAAERRAAHVALRVGRRRAGAPRLDGTRDGPASPDPARAAGPGPS